MTLNYTNLESVIQSKIEGLTSRITAASSNGTVVTYTGSNRFSAGQIVTITPEEDKTIRYRSRTESYEELLSLIKSYRSYPKYRNEESLKAIYDGFKSNSSMTLPIVIKFADGTKRVFSGNTRMDIAFQLGINPKVLLINSKTY
jgi:hypothetical protein